MLSSFTIILMGKKELVTLLSLSNWCFGNVIFCGSSSQGWQIKIRVFAMPVVLTSKYLQILVFTGNLLFISRFVCTRR